jgi:hypothetical protein
MWIDEIIYCLMFLRVYYLIKAILLFAPTNDQLYSKRICHESQFQSSFYFQVQAAFIKYEYGAVIILCLVSLISFTLMIQIWERPFANQLETPQLGFDTFGSSMWLAVMALLNLGVTPPYPSTYVGRALTLTANVIGLVVFSLLIGLFGKVFLLENI